ncbi:glycosyltransferase [bacterium]|nr:glycosyltransferase [bacterium]
MRVLFVLSQRPELTGSGITLDALVRLAAAAGHEPWVLCGVPAGEPVPAVGGIPADRVLTVTFGEGGDLPFAVPGMSDVMPYRSTVWSRMTGPQLSAYRDTWRTHLQSAVDHARPDVVHCNHLWLVSAIAPSVLGGVPSIAHCHATGLRQMELCPGLRDEVVAGLRGHRAFAVLHADHARVVAATLDVAPERIHMVGAGYRDDLFHADGAATDRDRRGNLLYVGKYAAAKGLPWLLDACERRWTAGDRFTLHVAGDGSGDQAEALRTRMHALAPRVVLHGRLGQAPLADLMRRCSTLVLPSFYEGLPLVLAEARACGCRLISTRVGGVAQELAPAFGDRLRLVDLPRLDGPDRPDPRDLPRFTDALAAAISGTMAAPSTAAAPTAEELAPLTWSAVFARVEAVWRSV